MDIPIKWSFNDLIGMNGKNNICLESVGFTIPEILIYYSSVCAKSFDVVQLYDNILMHLLLPKEI